MVKIDLTSKESTLATVMKQVLLHYYPNTIFELDIGFRGKRGGISKYDAYVPELNVMFEFQSRYHDSRQEHDCLKKEFAIKKLNCLYYELDHREYTPLEAIQLFFPWLRRIPHYVDYSKTSLRTWDLWLAQKLLDQGIYTYGEIAKQVGNGCTRKAISVAVDRKILNNVKKNPIAQPRKWSLVKAQSLLDMGIYTRREIANIIGNGCTRKAIERAIEKGQLIDRKRKTGNDFMFLSLRKNNLHTPINLVINN